MNRCYKLKFSIKKKKKVQLLTNYFEKVFKDKENNN